MLPAPKPRRRAPGMTGYRPDFVADLLYKRAVAATMGLSELETMLRQQIRWSLPVLGGSAPGDAPVPRSRHTVPRRASGLTIRAGWIDERFR